MQRLVLLVCFFCCASVLHAANNPYRDDVLWVVTPSSDNWLYDVNEEASIEVSVYRYGMLQRGIKVDFAIGPELLAAHTKGQVALDQGRATIDVGSMPSPGFKQISLSTQIDNIDYSHHIKLGFAPQLLTPYTQTPNDFEDFWQQQIREASEVPYVVEKIFVPEFSDDEVDCFLIKLQAHKEGQFVYGYLTKPKRKGKYPAVFSPPGAGVKPMTPLKDRFYAESGVIRFDMEIHGIRPDLDRPTYNEISSAFGKGNNSYLVNGLDSRDNYYMKKAYLSSLRVLDFLTSLPEWDGKNLIAQGTSQGGAIALVTAALDKRITAVAANHPALVDMAGYKAGRAGGYPHLFTKFDGMDTPQKLTTLQYYDVVNFIPMIEVPVFMSWGYNDNTCPPTTSYIAYNLIQSPKQALITPSTEHWISSTTRHKILDWIKSTLR